MYAECTQPGAPVSYDTAEREASQRLTVEPTDLRLSLPYYDGYGSRLCFHLKFYCMVRKHLPRIALVMPNFQCGDLASSRYMDRGDARQFAMAEGSLLRL